MIELEEIQKNIETQISKIDKYISFLESLKNEKKLEKLYKGLCDFGKSDFLYLYKIFMF